MSTIKEAHSLQDWAKAHEQPRPKAYRVAYPGAIDLAESTDISDVFDALSPQAQQYLQHIAPIAVSSEKAELLPPALAIAERVKLRALDEVDPERRTIFHLEDRSAEVDGKLHTQGLNVLGHLATYVALSDMTAHFSALTSTIKGKLERERDYSVRPGSGRNAVATPLSKGDMVSFRPAYTTEAELNTGDAYTFKSDTPKVIDGIDIQDFPFGGDIGVGLGYDIEAFQEAVNREAPKPLLYQVQHADLPIGEPTLRYFDMFAKKIPALSAQSPNYINILAAQALEGITV